MTNYRPVSLLMVLCRVLKKAMQSRLSKHLHTNNILVTELNGFRKGISTEDVAFRLTVYSNILTTKCMLKEFSVIWQRILIA